MASAEQDGARRAVVMGMPTVRVRRHAPLVAARDGDVRVSASVGPRGEVVVLWSSAWDAPALRAATTQPSWGSYPDPRSPRPVAARVTVHAPEPTLVTSIEALELAHPTVQPLPDGRTLVVGSRCRWRPEGPDHNAQVYDADGAVVAEKTLGDGIEHVQATGSGDVWVGYFDEGVHGNFGWGGESDSQRPVGASGLTRFAPNLSATWRYPSHVDNAWGMIDDCYALNVDGDAVWACYYRGFPIVRIEDGGVTGWRNTEAHGATALAVAGTRVALFGGYGPDQDRLAVGELTGGRFELTAEYRLVLPDSHPLPRTRVVGRGADLHFFVGDAWLRLSLDDLPSPW